MRLLLDHQIPAAVADQLQRYGHDVVTARDLNAERLRDDALWQLAIRERRVMVTFNLADFVRIQPQLAEAGQVHPGLLLISSSTIRQEEVGALVAALDQFIRTYNVVEDGVYYLPRANADEFSR